MIKYEVVRFDIETDRGRYHDIGRAFWRDSYDREIVGTFDTLDDARGCLAHIKTSVQPMSGYYLHECKCIEVNKYDDRGEFICLEGEEDVTLPCVEELKYYTASKYGIIDDFDTYEEAEYAINGYEEIDKEYGDYTPNFYKVLRFKGGIYE